MSLSYVCHVVVPRSLAQVRVRILNSCVGVCHLCVVPASIHICLLVFWLMFSSVSFVQVVVPSWLPREFMNERVNK